MTRAVVDAIRAIVPRSARNWLRDPRQTAEWAADSLAFAMGQVSQLEVLPGWVVQAHPRAVRRAYTSHVVDPAQEAELEAFVRRCRLGMQFLDVGAHFGLFSLAALHFGGPTARALAVDPSPMAAKMLAIQSRLNDMEDRLGIVQACVADECGRRGMLDTGVIGAGYFVPADGQRRKGDLSAVEAVTVDELCRRTGFAPTHLKIDVEGGELEVLKGACDVLRRARPELSVEIHNGILRSAGRNPREVVRHLEDEGYQCDDVQGVGGVDEMTFAREVSRITAHA